VANKVTYTSENEEFLQKITEMSGEDVTLCEQCGTCSGSCPMIGAMDITPSQMMRIIQLGQEEVVETKAIWLCASCYTCTVRCPRGIDVSKVAEAARQVILRQGVDHMEIAKMPGEEIAKLPTIALVSGFRKMTA
jgi:heterodisulfide reductase subunit C